jgi:hypothetical protein
MPDDIIELVLICLPSSDICTFSSTSKRMYRISSQNFLWKQVYTLKYGFNRIKPSDCKSIYRDMSFSVNSLIQNY